MKLQMLAVIAALFGFASPAAAAEIKLPRWQAEPSNAALHQALARAGAPDGGGRAAIRCIVDAKGALANCTIAAATSPAAAQGLLSLAPLYRMSQAALADLPADRRVTIVRDWFQADQEPKWRRRPTPDDLRVVWPKDAWARGLNGDAMINCLVSVEGTVFDCLTIEETPPGAHFGEAAIALTPQFLFSPALRQGRPVLSVVSIPVRFRGAEGGADGLSRSERLIPPSISWTEAPTIADVLAAYPAKAKVAKLRGFVSLHCHLDRHGRPDGCEVVQGEPRGQGFERAARTLAARFRLDPKELGRGSADTAVTLPIAFDADALEAATVGKPNWTRLPDLDELHAAFAAGKPSTGAGRAILGCTVIQGGGFADCSILSEQPGGSGLGPTAMLLKQGFRVATWSNEGLPIVGGRVAIPVRFDSPDETPPSAPPARPDAAKPTPAR